MFTLIALGLLVVVTAATDLRKFEGEWYHVAMYTAAAELTACTKYNVTLDGTPCTCGGRPASALRFDLIAMPVVVVEEYSEVADALNQNCTSGAIAKKLALRLVNDDYFVAYENCYRCTDEEPDTANLMARKLPSKSELVNLAGVDELRGRRGLTCKLVQ